MEPIIYKANVDVHFGDLDNYGHVNAKHYLDYVVTSRWIFGNKEFGHSPNYFIDKGIGFYLREFNITYKRPVEGVQRLTIESFAKEQQRSKLVVDFSIFNEDKSTTHATGTLNLAVIDVSTNKPTSMPDWCNEFLFR